MMSVVPLPFRVLFLDFDGVLNSRAWFTAERRDGKDSNLGDIDPAAVARLQRIVDETGASIVISSTWRLLHKKLVLQSLLSRRGLRARIAGVTPAIPDKDRGDEIQAWLNVANLMPEKQRPCGIAILDDDSDMAHLLPWLVRTPFELGLTDYYAAQAIEMLSRPPPVLRTTHAKDGGG